MQSDIKTVIVTNIFYYASAWNSGAVSVLCRERFWVVVDLKKR